MSLRHTPGFSLVSGSRESLPTSRMFIAPSTVFAGRSPVIFDHGSLRAIPPSMLLT